MTSPLPSISVVTATFNALQGLKQTVESVASQDYANVEHVIVDGGSNDGTKAYLEGLGNKVRWISEPDEGIADAMNKGIAMATGEYVLVLHAEDQFVNSIALSRAARFMDGFTDVISFNVTVIRENTSSIYRSRGFGPFLELFMTIPHQGALCRKFLYDRIGTFDTRIRVAMDYEFMLRAKRAGATVRVVNENLAIMPATGVSSRLDWPSVHRRIMENKAVQLRHCRPLWSHSVMMAAFWNLYPRYKKLRYLMSWHQR